MTRKNPGMREHKRRSKAKQAEESGRRRTASVVKDGIPYRTAAETRRSIAYMKCRKERLPDVVYLFTDLHLQVCKDILFSEHEKDRFGENYILLSPIQGLSW
jgi:hypothetical protein